MALFLFLSASLNNLMTIDVACIFVFVFDLWIRFFAKERSPEHSEFSA